MHKTSVIWINKVETCHLEIPGPLPADNIHRALSLHQVLHNNNLYIMMICYIRDLKSSSNFRILSWHHGQKYLSSKGIILPLSKKDQYWMNLLILLFHDTGFLTYEIFSLPKEEKRTSSKKWMNMNNSHVMMTMIFFGTLSKNWNAEKKYQSSHVMKRLWKNNIFYNIFFYLFFFCHGIIL